MNNQVPEHTYKGRLNPIWKPIVVNNTQTQQIGSAKPALSFYFKNHNPVNQNKIKPKSPK
jgi:hypothetical protein